MRCGRLISVLFIAIALAACTRQGARRVNFSTLQDTTMGTSVYVLGNDPLLGGGDPAHALKLSPHFYPFWSVDVVLPPGEKVEYRFLTRLDSAAFAADSSNAEFLSADPLVMTTAGSPPPSRNATVHCLTTAVRPVLEIRREGDVYTRVPFKREGSGRRAGEALWRAEASALPPQGEWQFRIDDEEKGVSRDFSTPLTELWLQDGQLFSYAPPPAVSAPRVIKLDAFKGRLATRPLYVYLPRGYDENTERRYPVLYMHDGQNCFQKFVADTAFGSSWHADETATRLIAGGRIPEIIIVGVSHGGVERIREYLPPYATYEGVTGTADVTAQYYLEDVVPYVDATYRTLTGREYRTVCGSSMGGLFSTYLACEHSEFARSYACLSSAYWVATQEDDTLYRRIDTIKVTNLRWYLDSGTISGIPGVEGDDGMADTYRMRDALIAKGYAIGPNLEHNVALGASHSEAAWAARFDRVLLFLFPTGFMPSSVRDEN